MDNTMLVEVVEPSKLYGWEGFPKGTKLRVTYALSKYDRANWVCIVDDNGNRTNKKIQKYRCKILERPKSWFGWGGWPTK